MARRRPEIHAQKFWRKFFEPISRKSRLKITKIPDWLNISAKLFRENKKNRVFPGWGPSLSDRSPPKTYSEKFSAKFNAAFRSVSRWPNLGHFMKIRPRRDRSGWFLIEKTTILTNSCCLIFNQPSVINPRPAGPLDFPRPAGGGGGVFEHPPVYLGSCAS